MVRAVSNGPAGDHHQGREIEALLDDAQWARARWLIQATLVEAPEDHWLLAQLGLAYFEQGDAASALPVLERAVRLAPRCPLVLWYYGAVLDSLGKAATSMAVFRALVETGVDILSDGECGLGRERAKAVMARSYERLRRLHCAEGRDEQAQRCFDRLFDLLDPEEPDVSRTCSIRIKARARSFTPPPRH